MPGDQTSKRPVVDVFALNTGTMNLPDRWLFEDGDSDYHKARQSSPDFCFLVCHPSGKKIMFDLGLIKDIDDQPPAMRPTYKILAPHVPQDVFELLRGGPVDPSSVIAVVYSHLHFDHTGDCTRFPDAEIIAGPGSKAFTTPGWPRKETSPFRSDILEHPHFRELSFEMDTWVPFGPFERAFDFFGDGTFMILDAPGHMAGHLAGLARTGSEEYVFMGGDCCHHRDVFTGARPMSVTNGPGRGGKSFHDDAETAMRTIEKARQLEAEGCVMIALAHDALLEGRMPEYPLKVNGWRASAWKKEIDEEVARRMSAKV